MDADVFYRQTGWLSLFGSPPLKGGVDADVFYRQTGWLSSSSSPPFKGGVAEGRGGCLFHHFEHMRLNVTNQPELKTFRTRLRKNLTPAEAKFWKVVQGSKLDGRKFRRQQSIGKYVLDFYCPQEKLAVELDGEVHFNELAAIKDRERRLFLEFFGIKVIRFENRLVFENLEYVLDKIRSNFGWRGAGQPPRPPATPPLKGGEL